MKTVVVRNIKRSDAELVKRLGALASPPRTRPMAGSG